MSEEKLSELMGELKQLDYKITHAKSLCYNSKFFNDCPGLYDKSKEILDTLEDNRRNLRTQINTCKIEIKVNEEKEIKKKKAKEDVKEINKKIKKMKDKGII